MSVGAAELLPGAGGRVELPDLAGPDALAARSPLQLFWRRFRRDRVALVSLWFIALLIVVAIAAPLVVSLLGLPGPSVQNPNLTNAFGSPLGPSAAHPFGVDPLGQDVASRVIYGTRVSLIVGIVGTAVATVLGTIVGLLAGYYRGWTDTLLSRLVDVVLRDPRAAARSRARRRVRGSGLSGRSRPVGPRRDHLPDRARQLDLHRAHRARSRALAARAGVRGRARAQGASDARIMGREILPNLLAPDRRLREPADPAEHPLGGGALLSRRGRAPPTASWGQMIAAATPTFSTAWWYMVFPGSPCC